jgi:hypothetical protein
MSTDPAVPEGLKRLERILTRDPIAATCAEALQRWDDDDGVWTVAMGALSPSYEQCIQILVFELLREYLEPPHGVTEPDQKLAEWGEAVVSRLDPILGFTGFQVGAAKNLASRMLLHGYRQTIEEVDKDRRIQVSRTFPVYDAATVKP